MSRRRLSFSANELQSQTLMNEQPPDLEQTVKRAIISDEEDGAFVAEYDNTVGGKNTMRLEAETYEDAVEEIKSFLGIVGDRDDAGNLWEVE